MASIDDTQPRSPFKMPPPDVFPDEPETSSGPGCLVWGLLGVVIAGVAVVIVGLSAFAGWSSGMRVSQTNATATQGAEINLQLGLLQQNIDSGNQVLLHARIEYLATLTPGVAGLDTYIATATALHQNSLPTATPEATLEPTAEATSEAQVEATADVVVVTEGANGGLDLAALLTEAQADMSLKDYTSAIETLDIILASDSSYQAETVRSLMLQSLSAKALLLFRSEQTSDLAEANLLTDRARQFGDIGELSYESYIASLYLDAVNTIGIDYGTSIQRLQAVYAQAPGYKDVTQRLFNQYIGYGDALVAQGAQCQAVQAYQSALGLFQDGTVNAKMTGSQAACANPTPVLTPGIGTTPGQSIAPVGQTG